MESLRAAIRRDWAIYGFVLIYVVASGAIGIALGAGQKFMPLLYVPRWVEMLSLVVAMQISLQGLLSLQSSTPLSDLRSRLAERRVHWTSGVLLCAAGALLHGAYTSNKTIAPDLLAFRFDVRLAEIDAIIHGVDAWRLLTWLNPFTDVIQLIYGVAWITLVFLVTAVAMMSPTLAHLRSRYAWTFILCWTVLGNWVSSLTLAAGPAFYQRVTGDPRFTPLMDFLAQHDEGASAHVLQNYLWTAYTGGAAGFATGISAFPSMHLSMSTLFALYAFKASRPLGWAFTAFGVLILFGSVHLGWHYAVDGYVSIIATTALWKLAGATRTARAAVVRGAVPQPA